MILPHNGEGFRTLCRFARGGEFTSSNGWTNPRPKKRRKEFSPKWSSESPGNTPELLKQSPTSGKVSSTAIGVLGTGIKMSPED